VYIKLVALGVDLCQEVALSFKKVGNPCSTMYRKFLLTFG